jgi:hypothetical protein
MRRATPLYMEFVPRCECHNCADAVPGFKIRVVEAVSLLGFLLICLRVVEAEIRGVWEALWR